MNYNWNVYKIFKNGKRAKAPIAQFEATEDEHISFFENNIKNNLSEKLKNLKFSLVRADMSQERQSEQINETNEKFLRDRNRVLGRIASKKGIDNKSVCTALIYYRETDWKWQWAAIQAGTSKYIEGLSPKFNTTKEAELWIESMISLET